MSAHATLYRMATEDHLCPWGLKAKDLLEREGFDLEDHRLTSRSETDAFKERRGVDTTPQIYIEGERIGGYDALREYLGRSVRKEGETTYQPVVAIFGMTAAMAVAMTWRVLDTPLAWRTLPWFAALSMAALAIQKLRDLRSFSTMFLNYDLLARRWVRYGYLYPFAEAFAAVCMLAGVLPFLSGPVALFIGTIGAASVIKAVYIDGRELKCACVGGDTNVPLGVISLTENLVMMAMGGFVLVEWALGSTG